MAMTVLPVTHKVPLAIVKAESRIATNELVY
jgi:hypothetical protein